MPVEVILNRLAEKNTETWMPDNSSTSCYSCGELFTSLRRKHHCRLCGNLFCGKCCEQKTLVEKKQKFARRLCQSCYSLICKEIEQFYQQDKKKPFQVNTDYINNSIASLKFFESNCISSYREFVESCIRILNVDAVWIDVVAELSLNLTKSLLENSKDTLRVDIMGNVLFRIIPGEDPRSSEIICGVACEYFIHSKDMKSNLVSPKILLFACSLMFECSESNGISLPNSSISKLIMNQQLYFEIYFKKMLKFAPSLIIVHGQVVSELTQLMIQHGITLVTNVDMTTLNAIARATQSRILNHLDELIFTKVGTCHLFNAETISWNNKYFFLMTFRGCVSTEMSSVILRGPDGLQLQKVRSLLQKLIKVVYYLIRERTFAAEMFLLFKKSAIGMDCSSSQMVVQRQTEIFSEPFTKLRPITRKIINSNDFDNYLFSHTFSTLYDRGSIEGSPSISCDEILNLSNSSISEISENNLRKKLTNKFPKIVLDGIDLQKMDFLKQSRLIYKTDPFILSVLSNNPEEVSDCMSLFRATKKFTTLENLKSAWSTDMLNQNPTNSKLYLPESSGTIGKFSYCFDPHKLNDSDFYLLNQCEYENPNITSQDSSFSVSIDNENGCKLVQTDSVLDSDSRYSGVCINLYQRSTFLFMKRPVKNLRVDRLLPCINPTLVSVEFFGNNDITLKSFLESNFFYCKMKCDAKNCQFPPNQHEFNFVHCEQILTARHSITSYKNISDGMNKSFMCSNRCSLCQNLQPLVFLTEETLNMSMAAYLELFFHSENVFFCDKCCRSYDDTSGVKKLPYRKLKQTFIHRGIGVTFSMSSITPFSIIQSRLSRYMSIDKIWTDEITNRVSSLKSVVVKSIDNMIRVLLNCEKYPEIADPNVNLSEHLKKTKFSLHGMLELLQAKLAEVEVTNPDSSNDQALNVQDFRSSFPKTIIEVNSSLNNIAFTLHCAYLTVHSKLNNFLQNSPLAVAELEKIVNGFGENTTESKLTNSLASNSPNSETNPYLESDNGSKLFSIINSSCSDLRELSPSCSQTTLHHSSPSMESSNPTSASVKQSVQSDVSTPLKYQSNVEISAETVDKEESNRPTFKFLKSWFSSKENHEFLTFLRPFSKDCSFFEDLNKNCHAFRFEDITSIISCAMRNSLYNDYISSFSRTFSCDEHKENAATLTQSPSSPSSHISNQKLNLKCATVQVSPLFSSPRKMNSKEDECENVQILSSKSTLKRKDQKHVKILINDDNGTKIEVTIFHAHLFHKHRQLIFPGNEDDQKYIYSLSRSSTWNNAGGKSQSVFWKTFDHRFVAKRISSTEFKMTVEFIPTYCEYIRTSMLESKPTTLCNIFGLYHIIINDPQGKTREHQVLISQNLFYGVSISRIYDLKGCVRHMTTTANKHQTTTTSSHQKSAPASDENSPHVYVDDDLMCYENSSELLLYSWKNNVDHLHAALHRDTYFLVSQHIMDYSLLAGVDSENGLVYVGIIDFLRQYSWDKKMEYAVNSRMLAITNAKPSPTVIKPVDYAHRFLKHMSIYFPKVPSHVSHTCSGTNRNDDSARSFALIKAIYNHVLGCRCSTNITRSTSNLSTELDGTTELDEGKHVSLWPLFAVTCDADV